MFMSHRSSSHEDIWHHSLLEEQWSNYMTSEHLSFCHLYLRPSFMNVIQDGRKRQGEVFCVLKYQRFFS